MYDLLLSKTKKFKTEKLKEMGLDWVFFLHPDNSVIINTESKEELRRQVSSAHSKGKIIVVMGGDDEVNRIAVDDKRVSILLSPELRRRKDFMHFRNSGMNHVLCELARKNDVAIGINYSEFKKMKGKEAAETLGRMMQNVKLCNKYHAPVILASFGKKPSSVYELRAFALSIGMTTDQTKRSLQKAKDILS
jgi:ribonuclease P/MRP protein subunit RPP1